MLVKVIPYRRQYRREDFDCGKVPLNNYIHRNVTKDVKTGACTCFVVLGEEQNVIGYYTLSTASVSIDDAPYEYKKKIKYEYVPVILLGRLAIDKNHFGQGIGKYLLIDALKRSLSASDQVGAVAIIVDPIDAEATRFYLKYGFLKLPDSERMFMSFTKIKIAFERQQNPSS